MINIRGALVVALATVAFTSVCAHAEKRMPQKQFCEMVRNAVKTYGQETIETMARASGTSEADIQSARRCLK